MEAPPVITSARPRSIWWLSIVLGIAATGIVLFLFNPAQNSFYPRCTLYTTTGLYCPGCGSLRALHQLTHAHVLAALHYNLLLVVSLPFVAFYSARCALLGAMGKPLPPISIRPNRIILLTVVLILFAILRNLPHAPFIWLAPP